MKTLVIGTLGAGIIAIIAVAALTNQINLDKKLKPVPLVINRPTEMLVKKVEYLTNRVEKVEDALLRAHKQLEIVYNVLDGTNIELTNTINRVSDNSHNIGAITNGQEDIADYLEIVRERLDQYVHNHEDK